MGFIARSKYSDPLLGLSTVAFIARKQSDLHCYEYNMQLPFIGVSTVNFNARSKYSGLPF